MSHGILFICVDEDPSRPGGRVAPAAHAGGLPDVIWRLCAGCASDALTDVRSPAILLTVSKPVDVLNLCDAPDGTRYHLGWARGYDVVGGPLLTDADGNAGTGND